MDFRIEEPFASELERMAVVSWRGRGGEGWLTGVGEWDGTRCG